MEGARLKVTWEPPRYDGGAPATEFVVDFLRPDGTVLIHRVVPADARAVSAAFASSKVSVQECNVAGCGAAATHT
jgi:hypothetical protein